MAFSQTLFAACVTRLSFTDTPSTVSLADRFLNSVSCFNPLVTKVIDRCDEASEKSPNLLLG